MALYDCQLAMLANVGSAALVSGVEPGRFGNGHSNIVPYQIFHAGDGTFVIAAGNDRQFAALCRLVERPELAADSRFATNSARVDNRDALIDLVAPLIATKPKDHWLEALRSADVPCGEVRGPLAALRAPEARARDMVREVAHPTIGALPLVASPLRLAETPVVDPIAPPLLGEHRDYVLGDVLGLDPQAIADLVSAGAVA
jgi:crotonobetainyl-CoA:carnitine CoA-transferase CaiB-like acyl-CoA transferase